LGLSVALAVQLGCSTTASEAPALSPGARDPVAAKIASQRAAAAPSLNLEAEDDRWGIEAARTRRTAQHATNATGAFPIPTDPPGADGGVPDGAADLSMP
jgi:hypothetical protein